MKKIAIIEDETSILEMYKTKFELAGFAVVTAKNGQTGLELIEHEEPDVVLLDLMMPEMTGDEMLEQLRKKPWGKDIPVIILTNVSKAEAPPRLQDLNILGYIMKANTTPHIVLDKVVSMLSQV